jgi:hypothetical protein
MREIRGGVFQGHFHNLLISKNNTFWAPQISRITFQVVTLISIGRIGGVAQGQFQTEVAVEIGGFEMHVAKDRFFLGRVFVVDVIADLGLEV